MTKSVGSASNGFAVLVEPTHHHAHGRACTLRDGHRDETPSEVGGENPERQPDEAAGYSAQAEKPVRSPHSILPTQYDHSAAPTPRGCDSHDPIVYLVIPQNHPATLSRAASEAMVVLDGDDGPLDVLAWCSVNNCRAETVFIGRLYRRGTRCWKIVAVDDDAAFAFRMRWV